MMLPLCHLLIALPSSSRLMLHRPSGIILPAFRVRGMLIWGFTAGLVDRLLALAGWEKPWDTGRVMDLVNVADTPR